MKFYLMLRKDIYMIYMVKKEFQQVRMNKTKKSRNLRKLKGFMRQFKIVSYATELFAQSFLIGLNFTANAFFAPLTTFSLKAKLFNQGVYQSIKGMWKQYGFFGLWRGSYLAGGIPIFRHASQLLLIIAL